MTKAMRWGASSLMIVAGISLGAFAGCSDDEDPPANTETDSGVDTGTPVDSSTDTGSTDTGSPVDMGTDTATPPADRSVTLLFAAPDLGPKFMCLGAFSATSDPAAADAPASFQPSTGALGVPDTTAPTDPTKTTAFPYGAVVPVPLDASAIAALKVFKVVLYMLDENPAKMATPSTCGKEWKNVKGDTKKWKAFDPGAVGAGEHALVSMIGCLNAPTDLTGKCGATGANFEFRLDKLVTAKPATGDFGVQFLHLSQFPGGGGAPSWSPVDIYLMPGKPPTSTGDGGTDSGSDTGSTDAATDATTDGGTTDGGTTDSGSDGGTAGPVFIKVADNVSYKSITATVTGITMPAGTTADYSYLVVAPRVVSGASVACSNLDGKPSSGCPNYTLPLAPFIGTSGAYVKTGGGLVAKTNQLVALVGSGVAPVTDAGTGAPSLRIPFAKASTWP